ncbi:MAG: transcriptional regulator [Acidimicrobiales bacterium]|nr:transcriptional regulator [Acidimicrobiales bacterium]
MSKVKEPVRRVRARRGEGGHLREELLAATERLLVQTGDEEAVSIRDIADAVGVSPPAIYLHFSDKDALIFAVCAARFTDLHRALEAAAAPVDDPLESLIARGMAYVRFGVENPEQYRILFMRRGTKRSVLPDELRSTDAFGDLLSAVERCLETGVLPARTVALDVALELWAAAHGVASLLIGIKGFPWPDDFAERVLRTYVRGLISAAVTSS